MSDVRGIAVLQDPKLNKSTAFTEQEKQALGLVGLVPDVTESEDLQLERVNLQLAQKPTDLERYVYLMNLLDHNETLFYRTLMSDPARFLPIVYDPTIGEACLKFGHIYRQARGMYLSALQAVGHVRNRLDSSPGDSRFTIRDYYPTAQVNAGCLAKHSGRFHSLDRVDLCAKACKLSQAPRKAAVKNLFAALLVSG